MSFQTLSDDLQEKVRGYWSERGFSVGDKGLASGLPLSVRRVTPRAGNARLPNHIHAGLLSFAPKKDNSQNERVLFRARVIRKIVRETAFKYFITDFDLVHSKIRKQPYLDARHEAWFLIREKTNLSYPAIGELMGGRDHSTIHHGVRRYSKIMTEKREG